jgi:hypothetical protein
MDEELPQAFEAKERQSWIGQYNQQMQTWQCVRVLRKEELYNKHDPVSKQKGEPKRHMAAGLRTDFRMAQKANGGFCSHTVKVGFSQVEL